MLTGRKTATACESSLSFSLPFTETLLRLTRRSEDCTQLFFGRHRSTLLAGQRRK